MISAEGAGCTYLALAASEEDAGSAVHPGWLKTAHSEDVRTSIAQDAGNRASSGIFFYIYEAGNVKKKQESFEELKKLISNG